MDLMQNDEGLREMPRKPSRMFVLWSYWCLISLSMFSCLLRQVMGRTWVLLVIALQTPASKLPHTLQPPPHPRQELNRQPAASDEDRTTMYRASTPTGAELTPTPHPHPNAILIVRDIDVLSTSWTGFWDCLSEHCRVNKRGFIVCKLWTGALLR